MVGGGNNSDRVEVSITIVAKNLVPCVEILDIKLNGARVSVRKLANGN